MSMFSRTFVLRLALVVGTLTPAGAFGAAGKVTGTIKFVGMAPPRAVVETHADGHLCGAKDPILRDDLVVGTDNVLANVAVVVDSSGIEAPQKGKAMLDQRNCTFEPHVQTVTAGTTLAIGNHDSILHSVHGLLDGKTIFNLALPIPGVFVEKKLSEPGVIAIRCESGHTWMSAYVIVATHNLHATTNAKGQFTIENVPEGKHTIRAWHERLGMVQAELIVPPGGEARSDLVFNATKMADPTAQAKEVKTELSADMKTMEKSLRTELDRVREEAQSVRQQLQVKGRPSVSDEGRVLFMKYCATCHGEHGDGRGPSARYLTGFPRDFRDGIYKFRMTESGEPPQVDDIYRTITMGLLGTEMPGWREVLTPSQRIILAEYVMTLAKNRDPEHDPVVIEFTPEPPGTDEGIARGRALYERVQCGQCHGREGKGDGPASRFTLDYKGNSIRPANLTRGYYKGGRGPAVVYRTISTGLSGTPMPSYAAILSSAERWDLAHYVVSLGTQEPGFLDWLFSPVGRISPP